jgi:DNA adenine methylase
MCSSSRVPVFRKSVSIVSPLRYPGSKRRLVSYIKESLRLNECYPELYVEAFAGGASTALQLLNDGVVQRIGLVERDPLVASFWKTVFFDPEWLIKKIETVDVSIEKWRHYKTYNPKTCRQQALACLFLNRTSFSGILAASAGPLGGKHQDSKYPLDCRFPRETLIKRVEQAAQLSSQVAFVWNEPWLKSYSRILKMQQNGTLPSPKRTFFYFDPPFFHKAKALYRYFFQEKDHIRLRDSILSIDAPWMLSYDSLEDVRRLYTAQNLKIVEIESIYSTGQNAGNKIVSEIAVSNFPELPAETRVWRTNHEWGKCSMDNPRHEAFTMKTPVPILV